MDAVISEDVLHANLPQTLTSENIYDIDDVELLSAHEESQRSGSIIPLLKQELKCKIQSRRLTEGKEELSLTENTCSVQSPKLTLEEMKKKCRRREQNRQAARTFRQNEKLRIEHLQQEVEVLEQKNDILRQTRSELVNERNQLFNALQVHMLCYHTNGVGFHTDDFYANFPVP